MMRPRKKTYRTNSVCDIKQSYSHLTNPVGQLVEIGEQYEIKQRFCTGFNILGGGYYMSAAHCMTSDSSRKVCISDDPYSEVRQGRCVVNFGFDQCEAGFVDTRIDSLKFVADGYYSQIVRVIDHGYCGIEKNDYGVLQLSPDAASFGTLELSPENLSNNNKITVVHHPEGYAKQYSTGAIKGKPQQATFNHTADTMGGSSGAPVISNQTGKVIGVHVAGYEDQSNHTAVTARAIVNDAATRNQAWVRDYLRPFGLFRQTTSSSIVLNKPQIKPNKCCN